MRSLFLKGFRLMLEEGARLRVPLPLTSVTTLEYLAGMKS